MNNEKIASELKRMAALIMAARPTKEDWDIDDPVQLREVIGRMKDFLAQIEKDIADIYNSSLAQRLDRLNDEYRALISSGRRNIKTRENQLLREMARMEKAIDALSNRTRFNEMKKTYDDSASKVLMSAYDVNNVVKRFSEYLVRSGALAGEIASASKGAWEKCKELGDLLDSESNDIYIRLSERAADAKLRNAYMLAADTNKRMRKTTNGILKDSRNVRLAFLDSDKKAVAAFSILSDSALKVRDALDLDLDFDYGDPGKYQKGRDQLPLDGPGLRANVKRRSSRAREAGLADILRKVGGIFKGAFNYVKDVVSSIAKAVGIIEDKIDSANRSVVEFEDALVSLGDVSEAIEAILRDIR